MNNAEGEGSAGRRVVATGFFPPLACVMDDRPAPRAIIGRQDLQREYEGA